MKNLSSERIEPNRTPITDRGAVALATFPALKRLSLVATLITDDGVKTLSTLENLELLDLRRTSVSDDALESLTRLKKLKVLRLADTKTTTIGRLKLGNRLPGCRITDSRTAPPPRQPPRRP